MSIRSYEDACRFLFLQTEPAHHFDPAPVPESAPPPATASSSESTQTSEAEMRSHSLIDEAQRKVALFQEALKEYEALPKGDPRKTIHPYHPAETTYPETLLSSLADLHDFRTAFPKELKGDHYDTPDIHPEMREVLLAHKAEIHRFIRGFIRNHFHLPIPVQIERLLTVLSEIREKDFKSEPPIYWETCKDNIRKYFIREQMLLLREKVAAERDFLGAEALPEGFTEAIDALVGFSRCALFSSKYENYVEYWKDFPSQVEEELLNGQRSAPPSLAELRERLVQDICTPPKRSLDDPINEFIENRRRFTNQIVSGFCATVDEVAELVTGLERQKSIISHLQKMIPGLTEEQKAAASKRIFLKNAADVIEEILEHYIENRDTPLKTMIHPFRHENGKDHLLLCYALLPPDVKLLFNRLHPEIAVRLEG